MLLIVTILERKLDVGLDDSFYSEMLGSLLLMCYVGAIEFINVCLLLSSY